MWSWWLVVSCAVLVTESSPVCSHRTGELSGQLSHALPRGGLRGRQAPETIRADAQQNRDRILAVAQTAFADDLDASLNSIAKLAGVGPGTLYRHFPTREDLILAVYRHEVQALADSVDAVLAENSPLDALRVWFLRLAVYVRIKHGLGEALNTAVVQDSVNQTYAPVIAAVEVLLRACEDAGQSQPGLKAGDVLLIMGCLWRVGPAGPEQAARLIDLIINGLRAEEPQAWARA